jgi:hypothetical protein
LDETLDRAFFGILGNKNSKWLSNISSGWVFLEKKAMKISRRQKE